MGGTDMRIAICDDDRYCRQDALDVTNEYIAANDNKAIEVEVFSHADDLYEAATRCGGYDVYILDVVMPDTDGIQLGERLRAGGYDGIIVYLTSSEEFAVRSYGVRAFDYLLKPIDRERLFACLDEAKRAVEARSGKSILVKTRESTVKLGFESILYAALDRRVISYHLTSGKTVETTQLRSTFSEAVAELLADPRFYPVGASMVLCLYHVTEIQADTVVLKGGIRLPLGKKAIREVRSAWCEYCLSEVKSK